MERILFPFPYFLVFFLQKKKKKKISYFCLLTNITLSRSHDARSIFSSFQHGLAVGTGHPLFFVFFFAWPHEFHACFLDLVFNFTRLYLPFLFFVMSSFLNSFFVLLLSLSFFLFLFLFLK